MSDLPGNKTLVKGARCVNRVPAALIITAMVLIATPTLLIMVRGIWNLIALHQASAQAAERRETAAQLRAIHHYQRTINDAAVEATHQYAGVWRLIRVSQNESDESWLFERIGSKLRPRLDFTTSSFAPVDDLRLLKNGDLVRFVGRHAPRTRWCERDLIRGWYDEYIISVGDLRAFCTDDFNIQDIIVPHRVDDPEPPVDLIAYIVPPDR